MFAVIEVAEPERHIYIFQSGAEAGERAGKLNTEARERRLNERYRVVPVASDKPVEMWQQRELARLETGWYIKLPWHNEPWVIADHFAHVSLEDGAKVAFTPNDTSGENDRQTRMRPGRYLERYYSGTLSAHQIRDWCSLFSAEHETNELQFATTPDDIEDVYLRGPTSCMSHGASDYSSECHPVRVYGAGDLAVAYLEMDGDVTARAICWPAKLRYGRVYGDDGRLVPLLEAAGYTDNGSFEGARLLRIEDSDNRFVAPYLDSPNFCVDDNGTFLIISQYGDIDAQLTNGLTEEQVYPCAHCGDRVPEGDGYCVDDETWCEHCYENYSYRCDACEETFSGSGTDVGRLTVCDRCLCDYPCCDVCEEHREERDLNPGVDCQICDDCIRGMEQTPCGLYADDENDCDCSECEEHRDELKPENFELEISPRFTPEPEPSCRPVQLRPTSPTVWHVDQLELNIHAAMQAALVARVELDIAAAAARFAALYPWL